MKESQLIRYVVLASLAGIILLTFAYHARYARTTVTMDELVRTEAVVPSVEAREPVRVIEKAVSHDLNYLNQLLFYSLHKDKTAYSVGQLRLWDGFIAVVAVLWMYRVGSICCSRFTGILGALILALTPPQIWGGYALRILIVLINWELFVFAVSRNTIRRWVLWSCASILLFTTGVFAEPILLQSWFIAELIVLGIWYYMVKKIPEWDYFAAIARKKKTKNLWERIHEDVGFSRYTATVIFVGVIIIVLSSMGGVFITRSILSIETLSIVTLLAIGLAIVSSLILLALPIFHRERNIILDWIVEYRTKMDSKGPYELFKTPGRNTMFKMCFAYSCAVLVFIPLFHVFYKNLNVFIDNWETGKLFSFINNSGNFYNWIFLFLPVVCWIITIAGYRLRVMSRGRVISVTSILILSSIYIIQQRYAIFSTPFYILCVAGVVSTTFEIIYLLYVRPIARK